MKKSINKIIAWRLKNVSEKNFLIFLSLVVGIITGFTAVLLKNAIHGSIHFLEHNFFEEGKYIYLILPLIGITLTVLFVKFIVRDNIGHGVSKVLYAISKKNSQIKKHNSWTSMVASTITIAFGGSVGAEAPVVLTGASIGSNLARLFRLNYRAITLMVGCGAAGAIAGIFKAPLTGMLFTLEVLMLDLTMASMIPLLVSAMSATTVAWLFMGDSVLFSFELEHPFYIENTFYYILLGVFCGIVSLLFTRLTMFLESKYGSIKSQTRRVISGAGILIILVFIFPSLWGEGYGTIQSILNNEEFILINENLFPTIMQHPIITISVVILLIILKIVSMSSTTGAGGVGGIFAPSLMVGSFCGLAVALSLKMLNIEVPQSSFALAGMAGMIAGVMHAPMTGFFLAAELSGGYDLLLPLIATSTISYITIMMFEPHSIYTKRLAQRGELRTHHKDKTVLMMLDLKSIVETDLVPVEYTDNLGNLVDAVSQSKRNIFPVLDSEGILQGVVLLDNVRNIMFKTELYEDIKITDIMITPPAVVEVGESMESVMAKFKQTSAWNLPVIDNGKYIGFVSKSKIFNEYRDILLHFSTE